MNNSKIIGRWSGCTHGKVQFATLEDAEEFSAKQKAVDLGWYWTAGEIQRGEDGTYWVVIP